LARFCKRLARSSSYISLFILFSIIVIYAVLFFNFYLLYRLVHRLMLFKHTETIFMDSPFYHRTLHFCWIVVCANYFRDTTQLNQLFWDFVQEKVSSICFLLLILWVSMLHIWIGPSLIITLPSLSTWRVICYLTCLKELILPWYFSGEISVKLSKSLVMLILLLGFVCTGNLMKGREV
jgi:hypothetical protein